MLSISTIKERITPICKQYGIILTTEQLKPQFLSDIQKEEVLLYG